MSDLRFPPEAHVRKSAEFQTLHAHGRRAGDDHLLIIALRNSLPITRIGLSISRRHGSAVIRNRKRRLLREAFRLHRDQLPCGLDLVLIPRQRTDSTLSQLASSLVQLATRVDRQLARAAN